MMKERVMHSSKLLRQRAQVKKMMKCSISMISVMEMTICLHSLLLSKKRQREEVTCRSSRPGNTTSALLTIYTLKRPDYGLQDFQKQELLCLRMKFLKTLMQITQRKQ
jgi:hypothetical protein